MHRKCCCDHLPEEGIVQTVPNWKNYALQLVQYIFNTKISLVYIERDRILKLQSVILGI